MRLPFSDYGPWPQIGGCWFSAKKSNHQLWSKSVTRGQPWLSPTLIRNKSDILSSNAAQMLTPVIQQPSSLVWKGSNSLRNTFESLQSPQHTSINSSCAVKYQIITQCQFMIFLQKGHSERIVCELLKEVLVSSHLLKITLECNG